LTMNSPQHEECGGIHATRWTRLASHMTNLTS
jgi:hypothetical protein